ncbi:MAG: hypothetical protein QXQ54_08060 [Thermoplasmata archaeon]
MNDRIWKENILSRDLLCWEMKSIRKFRMAAIFVLVFCVLLGIVAGYTKGSIILMIVEWIIGGLGFFILFFIRDAAKRGCPKKLSITKEGIVYIDVAGRKRFIPWSSIEEIDIIPPFGDRVVDDYFIMWCGGLKTIPVSEEIGREIKGVWESYKEQELEKKYEKWARKKGKMI